MTNNRKPLIIRNLVILGIYQLIGGIWGLGIITYSLFNGFELSTLNLIALFVAILFFGFSAFCGIVCIKKEDNALYLSRINQCVQLVSFSGTYFGIMYVAGIGVFFGVDLVGGLLFRMKVEFSSLRFYYSGQSDDKQIFINLVALFLLFTFNTLIKERKIQNTLSIE